MHNINKNLTNTWIPMVVVATANTGVERNSLEKPETIQSYRKKRENLRREKILQFICEQKNVQEKVVFCIEKNLKLTISDIFYI